MSSQSLQIEQKWKGLYNSVIPYYEMSRGYSGLINASISGKSLLYIFEKLGIKPQNMRVLDFGCGTGRTSVFMALKFGSSVLGIDYAEKRIQNGKEELRKIGIENLVKMETFDVRDYLVESHEQFDLILTFEIMEHLIHPEIVMQKLKGKIKPGGWLIGSCPLGQKPEQQHLSNFPTREDMESQLGVKIVENVPTRFGCQLVYCYQNVDEKKE